MRIIFFLVVVITGLICVPAQERFVKPVDEAKQDPSLVVFRDKLIAATKRRDTKFILSILDAKVVSSFGGDEGVAGFKRFWKFSQPNSEFWSTFLPVITNGGKFIEEDDKLFCAPYLFSAFPDDLDAFKYSAIFGRNVNLRSAPSAKSPVIAQLSYNVVEPIIRDDQPENGDWVEVRTLGGKRGFVSAKYVQSPIGYRACFAKRGGKWRMTAFVAGD